METPSLATRAIRSVLWTGSPFLVQIFTILLFYAVQQPGEMGLFETALGVVMLTALIGDLGMNAALVQYQQADERHFSSALWTNLCWGLCLTALLIVAAPLVAALLSPKNPEFFRGILVYLALLIPFASISGIVRARLQRGLRLRPMRSMALAEIISVLAYSAIALALLPHYGLWGLITGSIARELALLVSLWSFAAWRPQFCFSLAALKEVLSFALNFTGERTVGFLNSRLTQFVVLPELGATAAGYYSFASRMSLIPLVRLSTIIHRVSLPAFSSIQEDNAQIGRGYIKSIQSVALFFWPALMGLLIVVPELVQLGKELQPAAPVLRLLLLATILKAIGTLVGSIFLAKGKAHWSFRWALFSLAILAPALWFSLRFGVVGVAGAILLTALLFFALSQLLVHHLIHFALKSYATALFRPVLVNLAVLGVLFCTRSFILSSPLSDALQSLAPGLPTERLSALATLLQTGFLGLLVYGLALRLLAWDLCREYWQSFRGHRLDAASAAAEDL